MTDDNTRHLAHSTHYAKLCLNVFKVILLTSLETKFLKKSQISKNTLRIGKRDPEKTVSHFSQPLSVCEILGSHISYVNILFNNCPFCLSILAISYNGCLTMKWFIDSAFTHFITFSFFFL